MEVLTLKWRLHPKNRRKNKYTSARIQGNPTFWMCSQKLAALRLSPSFGVHESRVNAITALLSRSSLNLKLLSVVICVSNERRQEL